MSEEFDRRRILVVDDEERMVRFIRMNLEHDGFQVTEAFNGKQALQKLRDVTPDLILLDVMMPDLDGFEVLETIREGNNVPVIMLTAKGEEDDRVRGLELGADDGFHAADHFTRAEGLGDVVICTQLEPTHAVILLSLCREHDNGHIVSLANGLKHFETIQVGHHYIEQKQVRGHVA